MRILVIEDDIRAAKLLRIVLEERGHAVDLSHSGEDGRTRALVNNYDGIILDLGLADTDGLTILHDLRREHVTTPVLILSGQDNESIIVRALDAGADDYVVKPVRNELLLARVRALLRHGSRPRQTEMLTSGDFVINRIKRFARFRGEQIPMTTRELALTEFLLLHLDEPVTRSALLETLWGDNYDQGSNVVDALVNRVRRKLEDSGAELCIETLRGVGYRLRPKKDV